MDALNDREELVTTLLREKPLELNVAFVHTPTEVAMFRRHINPNGSSGGWVHEYAEVPSSVTVPPGTVVDAWASIHGVGTLETDTYYEAYCFLDFTKSSKDNVA